MKFMVLRSCSEDVSVFLQRLWYKLLIFAQIDATMSSGLAGETFPSRLPGGIVITERRAYGVVS